MVLNMLPIVDVLALLEATSFDTIWLSSENYLRNMFFYVPFDLERHKHI